MKLFVFDYISFQYLNCLFHIFFQGVKMEAMRFRFDGQPINETDTPSQLDMEDGDSIDVFQQQTGGLH